MNDIYNYICQLGDGYMLLFRGEDESLIKVKTGYPYPVIGHEGGQVGKLREFFHLGNFNFNAVVAELNRIEYPADLYTVYRRVKEVAYSGIDVDGAMIREDLSDALREGAGAVVAPSSRVDYYLFLLELKAKDWRNFVTFISSTEFELHYPNIGSYLTTLTRGYFEDFCRSVSYMFINPDGFVAVDKDTVRYDLKNFVPYDLLDRFQKKLLMECLYWEEVNWSFSHATENYLLRCISGAKTEEQRKGCIELWERFILGINSANSIFLTKTKNSLPIHMLVACLAKSCDWRVGVQDAYNLIHYSTPYVVSLFDIYDQDLGSILNLKDLLKVYYLDFKYFFWDAIMRSDFIVTSDYDAYNNLFRDRDLHLRASKRKITIEYD